jgi:hypothetical protein
MDVERFVNHFLLPLPEVNNKWLTDSNQENCAQFHDENATTQGAFLVKSKGLERRRRRTNPPIPLQTEQLQKKTIKRNNHHAGHHPDTQARR